MADRSTAAVGVANESGEAPLAAQQSGATPDGTATDDQTSAKPDHDAAHSAESTGEHADADLTDGASGTGDTPVTAASADTGDTVPARTGDAVTTGNSTSADAGGATDASEDGAGEPGAAGRATAAVRPKSGGQQRSVVREGDPARGKPGGGPVDGDTAEDTADAAAGAGASAAARDASRAATTAAAGASGGAAADTAAAATAAPAAGMTPGTAPAAPTAPAAMTAAQRELHSGHKLARRYQLAECVTRLDGFSSWRAVDEKLRRAVGIHILPAGHPRARKVLAAARSAALLGDSRFVQVLDAVEESDLVYVIHEWLPDAVPLADLLVAGPLEPHEAYQMVSQVSQGMAAAHREGLAHLRLDPGAVLRTASGQYRMRGLAVAAALRGLSSDRPQGDDTKAIGALLYAALTQRWPYEEDAHGLPGLPHGAGLVAPDQVRAGVHRGLSEIAMRALVNDGATASREEPPCTTPEELAKAVAGLPRIRPPEQAAPVYQPPAFQPPAPPVRGTPRVPAPAPVPPPALPGRTGQVLKWAVAALLIVAIGLGSWQLADALKSSENPSAHHTPSSQKTGASTSTPAPTPVAIVDAKDFDPFGDPPTENPDDVPKAYDGDPTTFWPTSGYKRADLGGLKPGVGLILDLGQARNVSSVRVHFLGATSVDLLAAPSSTSMMPTSLDGFTKVASGSGENVTLRPGSAITSRYVLVWLTRLPAAPDGWFRGRISEVSVTG